MPPTKPNNTKLKVTSAIVVTLAVVMLAIANTAVNANKTTQATNILTPQTTTQNTSSDTSGSTGTPSSGTQTTNPTTAPTTTTTSGYKDGTYTATSQYYVPHSYEEIQVSLTVKNGIVTDSSIQNSEGDRESAQFQEQFTAYYKSYVVGKNLSGLSLSRIAGASDTTQGFNDAVTQIQSKAQA
jgi:uncharacterized protein with FMN-binding domain